MERFPMEGLSREDDQKSAKKPTTPTTFHKFKELPSELQIKIIAHSLEAPRILRMKSTYLDAKNQPCQTPCLYEAESSNFCPRFQTGPLPDSALRPFTLLCHNPIPLVLQTTVLRKGLELGLDYHISKDPRLQKPVVFDAERDILHFDCEHEMAAFLVLHEHYSRKYALLMFHQIYRTKPSFSLQAVRYAAISVPADWKRKFFEWNRGGIGQCVTMLSHLVIFAKHCPKLEEVFLVTEAPEQKEDELLLMLLVADFHLLCITHHFYDNTKMVLPRITMLSWDELEERAPGV